MSQDRARLKATESDLSLVAHSTIGWISGDPRWSRVHASIQWVVLPLAGLLTALLVLTILWDADTITSTPAVFLFWSVQFGPLLAWVGIGPCLALVFAMSVLQTRTAVYKVAPTGRGLAIRFSPIWSRTIPWTDLWWRDSTHVEWIRLIGTGRAVVTPEQSQRIYRWFHPS